MGKRKGKSEETSRHILRPDASSKTDCNAPAREEVNCNEKRKRGREET